MLWLKLPPTLCFDTWAISLWYKNTNVSVEFGDSTMSLAQLDWPFVFALMSCDLEKMENNKQSLYIKYLVYDRHFTQMSLPWHGGLSPWFWFKKNRPLSLFSTCISPQQGDGVWQDEHQKGSKSFLLAKNLQQCFVLVLHSDGVC